jgi:hypothetical protein
MAETLRVAQMLPNLFEPKRKFRWILNIDGIDAFTLKTAIRPQVTLDETVLDYINLKRYVAGKPTWAPMTMVLYDPISPSAAQKVMEWIRLSFDPTTGRMGYAVNYQKEFNLKMLDPAGTVVENWLIRRAWIQDANFSDLDYSTSDPVEISLTIRFDDSILLS